MDGYSIRDVTLRFIYFRENNIYMGHNLKKKTFYFILFH